MPREAGFEPEPAQRRDHQCGRNADGHDHARTGERADRAPSSTQLVNVHVVRGLEDQARQKEREQQLLCELRRFDDVQRSNRETDHDERHRVGNARSAYRNGNDRRDGEQHDEGVRHVVTAAISLPLSFATLSGVCRRVRPPA